jgi:hypothetical protein
MLKLNILVILFLLLNCIKTTAQEKETITNSNGWYMYAGNHKFTEKWSLHTLIHIRRSNIITDWQQSLNRLGVNCHFNNNAIGAIGYDYVLTFPYGGSPITEKVQTNAIWQTVTLKQQVGKIKISHRYRLEQLWSTILSDIQYTYTNRFRYMISGTIPLYKNVFFSFFDEVFISFGKNVNYNNFNQNRIYDGIGYKIKHGDIQLGYMNQLIKKGIGLTYENNNTLMVGINYNMDFRK